MKPINISVYRVSVARNVLQNLCVFFVISHQNKLAVRSNDRCHTKKDQSELVDISKTGLKRKTKNGQLFGL